jgi:hypothetical protein
MTELLFLSLTLSAPPAEIPISVRANMAVQQATARITQNTPVGRTPTSSLLVPSQYRTLHVTPVQTQPTGVYSNPFVYPPVQQSGGITQVTTAQTVTVPNITTPVGVQVQRTPIRAVFAELRGITSSNCST